MTQLHCTSHDLQVPNLSLPLSQSSAKSFDTYSRVGTAILVHSSCDSTFIGLSYPLTRCCTTRGICIEVLGGIEERQPSLYYNDSPICEMPRTCRTAGRRWYTSRIRTLSERNADLEHRLSQEMELKNQAYYFILSRGLLTEFSRACLCIPPKGAHRVCLAFLLTQGARNTHK